MMKQIALVLCLLKASLAFIFLEKLSHTKLPYRITPSEAFQMFGSTAEESAYDKKREMLYIVGETSRLLHILDITDPKNPVRVHTHQFTTSDGIPRDVAVCGDEVAVAVTSEVRDVYEGHVFFFRAFERGQASLTFDGKIAVGYFPDMLTFSSNCGVVMVANEGKEGKDINNKFQDPPGSVTIIERNGAGTMPSERHAFFTGHNSRYDLRFPSRQIPQNIWPLAVQPTFEQDAQPEYIAFTPDDRTAYVILQKNNAVAKMSLRTYTVDSITPIPMKDWSSITIDPSDRDGGIHLRQFPLKSIRQPDNAKVMRIGKKDFLITADEGRTTTYTSSGHGFSWSDYALARTQVTAKKYDETMINNATFMTDLVTDTKVGRLTVSDIDDKDLFTKKMHSVTHFGGRGFSIWDASDFSLVYDSGDEIEKELASSMADVFNTDCVSSTITYQGPENLRDTQSDNYGPKIGTLDFIDDYGDRYIVVGSENTGTIFLYSVNITTGKPLPTFETAYRTGETDFVWSELYTMGEAGDEGISSVGFIPKDHNSLNKTMIYVVGGITGTVTLFQINNV